MDSDDVAAPLLSEKVPQSYSRGVTHGGISYQVHIQQPIIEVRTENLPNHYLICSVLSCVFCFWPLGLIAIYASLDTIRSNQKGDIRGARFSSDVAMKLNIASVLFGIIFIALVAYACHQYLADNI
ncbi:trafficking regulator of GLUT4 1-like [Ptychodera flava]|uniref:trafficking regulator of GLUT4 1-like n=1 Tax=Ptychodera flava TaxID=63121 RepID=UPI00396A20A2